MRQSPAVAENIRQPEVLAFGSELFPEELRPVQNLAYKRFSAGQIAVSLQPHCPPGFPASFFHPIGDLCEQFGIIAFDIVIQLRLGLQENILRILLHQPQDGGE
ncbi:hypothetical protein D3C80_1593830 [compost metagenome]